MGMGDWLTALAQVLLVIVLCGFALAWVARALWGALQADATAMMTCVLRLNFIASNHPLSESPLTPTRRHPRCRRERQRT